MREYTERLVNMSRIFRRPMFRKGGGANMNGIMSGIQDRQNYQEAGAATALPTVEELSQRNLQTLMEAAGDRGGYDPLTTFLLQYGPAVASATPRGGFLSTAVGAAAKPIETMLKEKAEEDRFRRGLRTQAAGAAIKTADDMRAAFEQREFEKGMKREDRLFTKEMSDIEFNRQKDLIKDERDYAKLQVEDQRIYDEKIRDEAREYEKMTLQEQREYENKLIEEGIDFELQKIQEEIKGRKEIKKMELDALGGAKDEDLKAGYRDFYEGSENQVNNRLKYEKQNLESQMNEKFGQNNAGLIGGMHGDMKNEIKSKNVGKTYYDVTDGRIKQVTRNSEGELGITIIDINSYDPDTAPSTVVEKKPPREIKYLSDEQRKKLEEIQKNAPPAFDPYG